MLFEQILKDEAAMLHFGEQLALAFGKNGTLYLEGELGAGKTTLTRGFLRGLGYESRVKSPTYTLVESYPVGAKKVYHFDLYRLVEPEELEFIGVRDYFNDEAICIVEWPERAQSLLPKPDLYLRIEMQGTGRRIEIEAWSRRGEEILKRLN